MPFDTPTVTPNRRQRRAAAKAVRRAPRPADAPENRRDFSAGVHTFLCENLEQFGNVLNQEHRAALMALCGCMTKLASGVTTGRYAFALPTGAGKTSAVIAWLTSLHWANADRNSGVKAPWSVVVCASIVAQINALPADIETISLRQLKKDAGLQDVPSRTFTRARQRAEELLVFEDEGGSWRCEGRSFRRCT